MNSRVVCLLVVTLLLTLQWPLWFGKGGVLRMRELEQELTKQLDHNEQLRSRNQRLRSEVLSLQNGFEAIEERARYDLGMVGESEIYVQLVSPDMQAGAHSTTAQVN